MYKKIKNHLNLLCNVTSHMSQLLKLTQRQRSKMDFVHFASCER